MSIRIAGVELEHPLMNAAGTCKTLEDVEKFARSAVSAIVVGSVTLEARLGNEGSVFWPGPMYSQNALGMPNRGHYYYWEVLPSMVDIAHAAGKALILSVAGFSPGEYGELTRLAYRGGVDCIELNLGCPNIWNGGEQKKIASFDPAGIRAIRANVQPWSHPVGVKLSPYSDPGMLDEVADALNHAPIRYVATCNTFPNSLVLDENGKPVIDVGFAGLSGPVMKPIGLGQVKQLRERLPDSIQLVGVGGITKGRDIWEYQQVGASAVQVATAYWNSNENPAVFGEILSEYLDLQTEEG